MNWLAVSLIAPFTWSLVNHAEKIILSRFFKAGGSGALMIFICAVAIPLAAVVAIADPTVLQAGARDAGVLVASGLLYSAACFLYLKVLEQHDTSYVVPFWQLTPVFTYVFGVAILNEGVAADKLYGSIAVMVGAGLLSTRYERRKVSFDWRSVSLMCLSSALLALGFVFFKDGGEEAPFLKSLFWNQVGMGLFGAALLAAPPYRRDLISVLRENSKSVLAFNIITQVLDIAAVAAANFAVRLAPAALVVLIEYSFQPLFVFLFGIALTAIFPRFVSEDMSRGTLIQRFLAIAIMIGGLVYVV